MPSPCVTIPVTMECGGCGTVFEPSGRRKFCSDACRQAVWRQRQARPAIPVKLARRETVYECPDCQTRYLGTQRCPDCNTFCTSLGPGAPCPHCEDPIVISDIINTPTALDKAARINTNNQ